MFTRTFSTGELEFLSASGRQNLENFRRQALGVKREGETQSEAILTQILLLESQTFRRGIKPIIRVSAIRTVWPYLQMIEATIHLQLIIPF